MFGISAAQVREFYNELRRVHGSDVTENDYRRVQSPLCICSLNCMWEHLYDVQRAWLSPDAPLISIRTLRDDFTRVAQLCRSPLLMNPELRFTQGVSWLSDEPACWTSRRSHVVQENREKHLMKPPEIAPIRESTGSTASRWKFG